MNRAFDPLAAALPNEEDRVRRTRADLIQRMVDQKAQWRDSFSDSGVTYEEKTKSRLRDAYDGCRKVMKQYEKRVEEDIADEEERVKEARGVRTRVPEEEGEERDRSRGRAAAV